MIKRSLSGKTGFLLLAFGILISSSLLTTSLIEFLDHFGNFFGASVRNAWSYFAAVILTGAVFWWLSGIAYDLADSLIASPARMTREYPKPCNYLIMGYSVLNNNRVNGNSADVLLEQIFWEAHEFGLEHVASPKAEYIQNCEKIRECVGDKLQPLELHNPWQQNVRALYPHLATNPLSGKPELEKIIVLRPNTDEKSWKQFRSYLEIFVKDKGIPVVQATVENGTTQFLEKDSDTPEDKLYESYQYGFGGVSRAIEMIANDARKAAEYRVDNICVDATAGQKIYSIGAAVATLNRDAVFSYVNNSGKVIFYDAKVFIGKNPQ